jgi:DNA-binding response OmpR family regulator
VPKQLLIALVENDDLILKLLQLWLTKAGHVTRTISESDLRAADAIDLIVVDAADASAAAAMAVRLRAVNAAPLLLMSARFHHGAALSGAMAAQLGVDAVLPKPFTYDELLAAVAAAAGPAQP